MPVKRFDFVWRTGISQEPVICKIGWRKVEEGV